MPIFPDNYYIRCCDSIALAKVIIEERPHIICSTCNTEAQLTRRGEAKVIDECIRSNKCNEIKKCRQLLERKPKQLSLKTHTWITICIEEYKHENIKLLLNSKLKYLKGGEFTHEFWSGTPPVSNPHIHLLLPLVVEKSRIVRDFSRLFKLKANFIDVKYGDDADKINRVNYLKGQKKEETKVENCRLDNESREKLKIKSLYVI